MRRYELSDEEWERSEALLPGRRVATRHDKTAHNYLAFVQLAAAKLLLRSSVNTAQARAKKNPPTCPRIEESRHTVAIPCDGQCGQP